MVSTKRLYDHIISLKVDVWAHKTNLPPAIFYYNARTSLWNKQSCICVSDTLMLPVSTIFLLDFGTGQTVWYCFCFFIFMLTIIFISVASVFPLWVLCWLTISVCSEAVTPVEKISTRELVLWLLVINATVNNTCVDRLIDWLIEETEDTH